MIVKLALSAAVNGFLPLLTEATDPVQKDLLNQEIREVSAFALTGEVIERQFYLILWEHAGEDGEKELLRRARELENRFSSCEIVAELCDTGTIIRLCNLFPTFKDLYKQFVTVAVCATEPHMGATHHALAIAKFLSGVGYRACYLEANPRRRILYLARAYPVNANERKNLLQFEGVDMYFDFSLPEVIAQGYDFYIFDFGSFLLFGDRMLTLSCHVFAPPVFILSLDALAYRNF